jgi:hypothetical protein
MPVNGSSEDFFACLPDGLETWEALVTAAARSALARLQGGKGPLGFTSAESAFAAGAVIGFALGQTWPASPQAIDSWPSTAIAVGRLQEWAARAKAGE